MLRIVVIVFVVLIVGLQLFRGEEPEVTMDNPDDLLATYEVPSEVAGILKSACYDCHSNASRYPWYSYITPISWFIFDHIEEGREELNFSEWASFEKRRKIRKLKEIGEEVEEGEMPLESYTYIHGDARLTEAQKTALIEWTEELTSVVISE